MRSRQTLALVVALDNSDALLPLSILLLLTYLHLLSLALTLLARTMDKNYLIVGS